MMQLPALMISKKWPLPTRADGWRNASPCFRTRRIEGSFSPVVRLLRKCDPHAYTIPTNGLLRCLSQGSDTGPWMASSRVAPAACQQPAPAGPQPHSQKTDPGAELDECSDVAIVGQDIPAQEDVEPV